MKGYVKIWFISTALALIALALIARNPWSAHAAGSWYVSPGGSDANTCLSPAARCATINGTLNKPGFVAGDTIRVAVGIYTGIGTEVVLLNKNATLSGGWNSTFTTQNGMSTIDGQGTRRGITVNNGVTAMVERFVVQNGRFVGNGAGILNNGILIITNVTVSNNFAVGDFREGGGIYNEGILTLNNGTVSGNKAGGAGSGSPGYGGGIMNNGGVTTLNNSTITDNTAGSGNGIYDIGGILTLNNSIVSYNTGSSGGAIYTSGISMTLNNSIISHNTSDRDGGGIFINTGDATLNNSFIRKNTASYNGGGIHHVSEGNITLNNSAVTDNKTLVFASGGGIYKLSMGLMILNNSTVSHNTSYAGGGIYTEGGSLILNNSTVSHNSSNYDGGGIYKGRDGGTATLNNSTVSHNISNKDGGGLYIYGQTVTLQNTILAHNTAASGPNCLVTDLGVMNSLGYNLIANTFGCTFSASVGDLLNVDPGLFPLIGSPGYHPLLLGSPAIDGGNLAGCMDHLNNPLNTDQRGASRVGRCDIGAYEFDPNNNPLTQVFLPLIVR